MNVRDYAENRIRDFEQQLTLISACREKEMCKPPHKRDYHVLYMFHKDEALYAFCIEEFRTLLINI